MIPPSLQGRPGFPELSFPDSAFWRPLGRSWLPMRRRGWSLVTQDNFQAPGVAGLDLLREDEECTRTYAATRGGARAFDGGVLGELSLSAPPSPAPAELPTRPRHCLGPTFQEGGRRQPAPHFPSLGGREVGWSISPPPLILGQPVSTAASPEGVPRGQLASAAAVPMEKSWGVGVPDRQSLPLSHGPFPDPRASRTIVARCPRK